MIRKILFIFLFSAVALICNAKELPLPTVPAELTTPKERAHFIATHFWDALPDMEQSISQKEQTQNFVNFLSLFPHLDISGRIEALDSLQSRIKDTSLALTTDQIAREYLFTIDSPMYSTENFLYYLEACQRADRADDQTEALIELLEKNRPGDKATDFPLETTSGCSTLLAEIIQADKPTILLFYDPDCDSCSDAINRLNDTTTPLGKAIADNKIAVIAINPGFDKDAWALNTKNIPTHWINAYADSDVQDNDLYIFWSMPTLYLVDASAIVICRDTGLSTISERLKTLIEGF